MRLFGFDIVRATKELAPVWENRGGWFPIVREPFTGAWQRNQELRVDQNLVTSNHAVYACVTRIVSDIAKLRMKLVAWNDKAGIWQETSSASFSPVLRKPNPYQTRIQFWDSYFLSKLLRGNTYVLKQRDNRNIVTAMYVLAPDRVTPLVADDGSVFYRLSDDKLSRLDDEDVVPDTEIIHDRWNCIFHPLIGTSPLYAAGMAAAHGMEMQRSSGLFFQQGARPSGVLTAPGEIEQATADRLREAWETKFTGAGAGKIAVLGDGLKYEPMMMTSVDSQLVEQMKWTAEVICSVFHVPPYKLGLGPIPTANNLQSLNVEYYSQALQRLIEDAELCLDEGLGLTVPKDGVLLGTEFDLEGLLRMDSLTQMEVIAKGRDVLTPDEQRRRLDLPPVAGGDAVYRQQQDFSLAALAKRDAKDDPFAKEPATPAATAPPAPEADDTERAVAAVRMKYAEALYA
jgi:HK97 family phage portal protein